jgi:hypothetical protein
MTAPAVPMDAPVLDQNSPFAVDEVIASITKSAVDQTIAESPDAPAETPRDEKTGRFTPKEPAAAPDALKAGVPADEPETIDPEAPITLPEGMVAVPKVDRQLATAFKIRDKDGELEIPDLMIDFPANGKDLVKPLDEVVRLAQRGFYNDQREQQVVAERQQSQSVLAAARQLETRVQQLEAERAQLLSSDDAYLNARARHEAENTPEARLQRDRAEFAQQQEQALIGQATQMSAQFFDGEVVPAVDVITKHLPEVSADEIGARMILLTNHLRVQLPGGGSLIPPGAHQQVRDIVLREITPWAQQLNDHRAGQKSEQTKASEQERAKAKAETERLRVEAQKSKSLVGKAGKPANRGDGKESKAPKPITNIDEAQDAALDATFAAIGLERPRGS